MYTNKGAVQVILLEIKKINCNLSNVILVGHEHLYAIFGKIVNKVGFFLNEN